MLAYIERVSRYFTIIYMYKYAILKFNYKQIDYGKRYYNHYFNQLSLEEHFWAFISLTPKLMLIVGVLEILGGLLLIFEKTKLIGVIILFPLLLNVFLLDLFYQVNLRALVNVSFYLGTMLLTAYTCRSQLKEVFLSITNFCSIENEIKSYMTKKGLVQFSWVALGIFFTYIIINIGVKKMILGIDY